MAKQIAKLLKTDVMADIDLPALAQLLQKLGRKGDKILAHITPKEAKKLKEEGGSGTINPKTGLPEFYDGEEDIGAMMAPEVQTYGGPSVGAEAQTVSTPPIDFSQLDVAGYTPQTPSGEYPAPVLPYAAAQRAATGREVSAAPIPAAPAPYDVFQQGVAPETMGAPSAGYPLATPEDKNFLQKYWAGLSDKEKSEALLKGGLSIGTGLLGLLQANRAAKQAQQAKSETAALGQPYQQQGQEMIAQARRGELTPAGQQRLQAARAALAQGVERRGGVGAQQAATQLESLRQQLLDNQYNYGLKVAQIGDTYAQRAIQVGLTQDREIASMMQNLSRALGGFAGSQPGAQ